MFNEKKAKMDPNKLPFSLRPPGVPLLPGARGQGLLADKPSLGQARGSGVTSDEVPVGRARGLALASEEPLVGRARALMAPESSSGRARGLLMMTDKPSVGRTRGLSAVAPAEASAGRGRGRTSAALHTPLFPHGRGSPVLGSDKGTGEEGDGDWFGRARGLLRTSPEPAPGKERSAPLSVKEVESPGERERADTAEDVPRLQEEPPPRVQASMWSNPFLHLRR